MAGLTTHVSIALLGAIIIFFLLKLKYKIIPCLAFFLGNLIPDIVDFGIIGIKIMSLNPHIIMLNKWFSPLALFAHSKLTWIVFAIIIIIISLILLKTKSIKKQIFNLIMHSLILFLIGISIHLFLDFFVQETSVWI